jgi:hypothetical protein
MKQSVLVLLMVIWAAGLKAYSEPATKHPVPETDTTISAQPLRLRSFTARILSGNRIELNWTTAETWTNVTHFEIQRSYNSADFETTGTVLQTDTRPIDQYYRFTDGTASSIINNTVYYRLKQVNRDGRSSHSFILPVKRDDEQNAQINVWPVPAKDELTVSFNSRQPGEITVHVLDITGKKVKTNRYESEGGKNMVQLSELKGLNAGVYIVQVWSGNTMLGTAKFLKGQ